MLLALCGLSACSPEPSSLPTDVVQVDLAFFNGRIHTLDPARPEVQAIAVRDGRIVALGDDALIEPHTRTGARLVDLQQAEVLPALGDLDVRPWPEGTDAAQAGAAITGAARRLVSLGVLRWRDPAVPLERLPVYEQLARSGQVAGQVDLGLLVPAGPRTEVLPPEVLAALVAARARFEGLPWSVSTVTLPLGEVSSVPVDPAATVPALAPAGPGETPVAEVPVVPSVERSVLAQDIAALLRRGFRVRVEAAGALAARAAVDAMEAAVAARDIPVDRRLELAGHLPDDRALWTRLAALDVAVQPAGEGELLALDAAGVTVAVGSGWPAAGRDADPWPVLARLRAAQGAGVAPWAFLRIHGPLTAQLLGDATGPGSLTPGARADLLVFDAGLSGASPETVATLRPRQAWSGGVLAFEAPPDP